MIKDIINNAQDKMKKSIGALKSDLNTLKAGRANPKMLDRIEVIYYDVPTPLTQVANVSAPEARVLLIQPWDKSSLKDIERAILTSDLGLNPNNDGEVIRLIIPELTEETRKNLTKKVKQFGENSKVAIRAIRKTANEKVRSLNKDNEITDDELKQAEDAIQKQTDVYVKEVDSIVAEKEKEVMSV